MHTCLFSVLSWLVSFHIDATDPGSHSYIYKRAITSQNWTGIGPMLTDSGTVMVRYGMCTGCNNPVTMIYCTRTGPVSARCMLASGRYWPCSGETVLAHLPLWHVHREKLHTNHKHNMLSGHQHISRDKLHLASASQMSADNHIFSWPITFWWGQLCESTVDVCLYTL